MGSCSYFVRHKEIPLYSWLLAKPISFISSPAAHSPRDKAFSGSLMPKPVDPRCQKYHRQRFLNGLGSNDTRLFRLSSFWGTNLRFSPQFWTHPTISDFVFMPKSSRKYMLVRLQVSKTDPFKKGQTIVVGRENSNLCLQPTYPLGSLRFRGDGPKTVLKDT